MKGKMADKVTPWEDYEYEPRLLDLYQVVGITAGFATMCGSNVYRRLPAMYKPLINIPLFVGSGLLIGTGCKMLRTRYLDNKLRIAESYIQQHPEQFTEGPKKKYGDLLLQWTPRR